MVLHSCWIGYQVESIYHQRTGLQHKKKTMENKKFKRNRNAYKAFVQETMEGATRILSSDNWITTQDKNNGQ